MKPFFPGLMIAVLMVIPSCAGTIPEPADPHLAIATHRWPGIGMHDLASGRRLYVMKCSGCHSLHAPDTRSAEQWEKAVPEMIARARLTNEEAILIVRYLVTMAEAKRLSAEKADAEPKIGKKKTGDE